MLLRASIAGVPRQTIEGSARDLGMLLRVDRRGGAQGFRPELDEHQGRVGHQGRVRHVRQGRSCRPGAVAGRRVVSMQWDKGRGKPGLLPLRRHWP